MLGWCMWQVMHCAVGIARVKTWRIGWPRSPTAAWLESAGASCVAPCLRRGRRRRWPRAAMRLPRPPSRPRGAGPGAGAAMVGIDGRRLPVAAILGIGQAVPRLAVVGVDDVAAGAARMAIVAGLVVGAHEPHEGVVEPGLVDVEHRDRDAQAGARAAVRLAEVGPARLLEPLDRCRSGWAGRSRGTGCRCCGRRARTRGRRRRAGRRARSAADRARRARRARAAAAVRPFGPSGETICAGSPSRV